MSQTFVAAPTQTYYEPPDDFSSAFNFPADISLTSCFALCSGDLTSTCILFSAALLLFEAWGCPYLGSAAPVTPSTYTDPISRAARFGRSPRPVANLPFLLTSPSMLTTAPAVSVL